MRDSERHLLGEAVELRRHLRENYPLYAEWYADPEIWRLTSWTSSPLGKAAVEQLFEERESSPSDESFAIHRKSERKPIGVVSLTNINERNSSADLSIIVGRPEDRERGYGAEAIELLLRHAFERLELQRVGLSVFDFNAQAISTYEKLGFRVEGRLHRVIKRYDGRHDAILMRILKPEWETSRRP